MKIILEKMDAFVAERDRLKKHVEKMREDSVKIVGKIDSLRAKYDAQIRNGADDSEIKKTFKSLQAAQDEKKMITEMIALAENPPKSGTESEALKKATAELLAEASKKIAALELKREKLIPDLEAIVKKYYNTTSEYGRLLAEEIEIFNVLKKEKMSVSREEDLGINRRLLASLPCPDARQIARKANEAHEVFLT